MSDEPENADEKTEETHKAGLGERIREHLRAAEVAAEESAGYGFVTEAVEAAEAAVNPEHELGPQREGDKPDEDASAGKPAETPRED